MNGTYIDTFQKLETLKGAVTDSLEFNHILTKLLGILRDQYQLRLDRYARDLREYEERFNMDTQTFHDRFGAGELGDSADFFEWDGVYDLHRDLAEKIRLLESAL